MVTKLLNYQKLILTRMDKKDLRVYISKIIKKQLLVPFAIYADSESATEKISGCQPSDRKSYTEKYQWHTACSFSYKVVCCYDKGYS